MKEFMFMAIGSGTARMDTMSAEEKAAMGQAYGAWMGQLMESGQLINPGAPLGFAGKRITQEGVVTDLGSVELKEIVSGYMIIKAEDMDAALEIAMASPMVRIHKVTLDVREIMPAPKFKS